MQLSEVDCSASTPLDSSMVHLYCSNCATGISGITPMVNDVLYSR